VPFGKTKSTHVRGKKLLKEYAGKRDFARTPEPAGSAIRPRVRRSETRGAPIALRSAARDGRSLEKLWAVTKGPSLTAGEKRLAVRTEDHPIEYLSFEGNIP
jgi:bifunctional non-homologous end joining protein LigD